MFFKLESFVSPFFESTERYSDRKNNCQLAICRFVHFRLAVVTGIVVEIAYNDSAAAIRQMLADNGRGIAAGVEWSFLMTGLPSMSAQRHFTNQPFTYSLSIISLSRSSSLGGCSTATCVVSDASRSSLFASPRTSKNITSVVNPLKGRGVNWLHYAIQI